MLIEVTVQGITPLMLHGYCPSDLLKGPKSTNGKEEMAPRAQAERCLYKDAQGKLIMPLDNLLTAIVFAGKFIKVGKRQLSTRDTTTVVSFLAITDDVIYIKSEGGWRVDARPITNQVTKGKHMAYRPIFDDWQLNFTLDVDLNEVSVLTVRELIDRAGRYAGLGVMRPSCGRRYGMFKVIHWVEKKVALTKAA